MKALYTTAPGRYGLADRPRPEVAADEVLVRVSRAGFCMNDIRIREGVLTSVAFPLIPGHQFAGCVEACGADVSRLSVGDRVVAHSYVTCGQCYACRTGPALHDCDEFTIAGFTRDGGLAEYNTLPERYAYRLADHVTMDEASLVENTANAVAAVRVGDPGVTDRVVVIGATPIGLLAAQVARLVSPRVLALAGTGSARLGLAESLGATHTVDLRDDAPRDALDAILGGRGANVVIVCGYSAAELELAMDLVGATGRIVVEGHFDPAVGVTFSPFTLLVAKSVALQANRGWMTRDFVKALDLVARGMVEVAPLITHRLPLESWETGFDIFTDSEGDAVQVVLEP